MLLVMYCLVLHGNTVLMPGINTIHDKHICIKISLMGQTQKIVAVYTT